MRRLVAAAESEVIASFLGKMGFGVKAAAGVSS
jgi:hypothetical protein